MTDTGLWPDVLAALEFASAHAGPTPVLPRRILFGCPEGEGGGPPPDPHAPLTLTYELGTVTPYPGNPLAAGHLRGGGQSQTWWADADPAFDPFWSAMSTPGEWRVDVAGQWWQGALGADPVLDPGGFWVLPVLGGSATESAGFWTVEGTNPGAIVTKVVGR